MNEFKEIVKKHVKDYLKEESELDNDELVEEIAKDIQSKYRDDEKYKDFVTSRIKLERIVLRYVERFRW